MLLLCHGLMWISGIRGSHLNPERWNHYLCFYYKVPCFYCSSIKTKFYMFNVTSQYNTLTPYFMYPPDRYCKREEYSFWHVHFCIVYCCGGIYHHIFIFSGKVIINSGFNPRGKRKEKITNTQRIKKVSVSLYKN